MERKFFSLLRDPFSRSELDLHIFESHDENIVSGVLLNHSEKRAFPVVDGVPVMMRDAFPKSFSEHFRKELQALNGNNDFTFSGKNSSWSFSAEWQSHFENELDRTWGWTVEQRFEQLLLETQTDRESLKTLSVLDAGCGNGMLTEYTAENTLFTIGVDMSDSVFMAEKNRKSKQVAFIKGDLQQLPFDDQAFDIIVSNGVIHHTPNTETTFYSLARTVKAQGKLYIWLYSRKGGASWRIKRRLFDWGRVVVSRTGPRVQRAAVGLFTRIIGLFHKGMDREELRIDMYDSLTPRWRHYHTPEEIAYWYYRAGFGPLVLSHFDNRYGFGACARKEATANTPGENFPTGMEAHT